MEKLHHKNRDITGQRFNMLIAEAFYKKIKDSEFWIFKCDCGKRSVMRKHTVIYRNVRSCGCVRTKYLGKKFGTLKVVGYAKCTNFNVRLLCECDCGDLVHVYRGNLTSGKTISCKKCPGNKRQRNRLTFMGRNLPLMEWAKVTGIRYQTILSRYKKGWPTVKILVN